MCVNQFTGDLLLKIIYYFEVMFKMFGFSCILEIIESSFANANNLSESPYLFPDQYNKTEMMAVPFS